MMKVCKGLSIVYHNGVFALACPVLSGAVQLIVLGISIKQYILILRLHLMDEHQPIISTNAKLLQWRKDRLQCPILLHQIRCHVKVTILTLIVARCDRIAVVFNLFYHRLYNQ